MEETLATLTEECLFEVLPTGLSFPPVVLELANQFLLFPKDAIALR